MKVPAAMTYLDIPKNKVSADFFRNKLRLKAIEAHNNFKDSFPEAAEYFASKGLDLGKLREHSAKIISAGALTGTLLLYPPTGVSNLPAPKDIVRNLANNDAITAVPQKFLLDSLKNMLPSAVRPLAREEEKRLEKVISDITKIPAKATLEGEHLNTTYGYIGAEQHLKRYPGDSLENHGPYFKEGIAPGLGAWSYFAKSRAQLTKELEMTEKWYAVVQTLYLPDWSRRQPYLRDWYKYRKVLILNTKNGNAVVAAIADSGPAAWTGKHFGGSPEVMEYLGGPRYKKGAVILFFVDDPENKIPLGPVEYNQLAIPESLLKAV